MGDAAPFGIVTLVLIESGAPIPDRLVEEFRGHALEPVQDRRYAAVFGRASDGLHFALRVVRERREEASAAVVTHEMDLSNSDDDQWAYRRAQTVLSGAFEGMILVSSGTREVLGRYPDGFGLMKLGRYHLPDEERPETLYRLTHRAIRSSFPRATRFADAPNNLPSLGGAFRGRDQELEVIDQLAAQSRRIVLLGPAGIGKSRVALAYGQRCMEQDFDGVWLVNLQPAVNIGERLANFIAEAIGAPPNTNLTAFERICQRLDEQNTLLILDGCETAGNAVSRLVPELTGACANLLVLLTSQTPLAIEKQATYDVPPLSGGPHGDAVDLFLDRLSMVHPDFDPDEDQLEEISEVCDRLANVPMAIELVAPHYLDRKEIPSSRLSPEAVVEGALDWIVSHLTKAEIKLAHAAAVFRGPIHAEAILKILPGAKSADLDLLAKKAILIPEGGASYRMLNAVRDYFARLDHDLNRKLDRDHANYYTERAKEVGESFDQTADTAVFGDDSENYNHALETLCRHGDSKRAFDIAYSMFDFWFRTATFSEGVYWMQRVIGVTDDTRSLVRLMNMAASLALGGGEFAIGSQFANDGIGLARRMKSHDLLARLFLNSGLLLYGQENFSGALNALHESRKCALKSGAGTAIPDLYSGAVLAEMGEFRRAEETLDKVDLDHLPPVMRPLLQMRRGISCLLEGRHDEARDILERSLVELHRAGDQGGVRSALRMLATIYSHFGMYAQCARFAGAAEAIGEGTFGFWPARQRELYNQAIGKATAQLGVSLFEELWNEGFDASLDRIVYEVDWNLPNPD